MTTQPRRRARILVASGVLVLVPAALGATESSAAPTPIPVGQPPVAVITVPSTVYAGIPVTLSGSKSSTPSGGISEWEWDLDGDGRYEQDSTSAPWVSKSFARGKHTVKLRVRNSGGLVATTTETFTAKRTPTATSEPGPPTSVTATADRTSVDVTWAPPADAVTVPPLVYRVSNGGDRDTDPIYVPADDSLEATFTDLVPGDYDVRVAAVNGQGTGPSAGTSVQVLAKGATPSARATSSPSATPVDPAGGTGTGTPTAAAASTGSGDDGMDRDTIGMALIAAGGVVLLGAAVTAGISAWRRRRAEPSA